jgi:hypothetical protein
VTTNQTPDVNSALAGVINRSQWRQTLATEYEATAARLQTAYARVLPRLQDAAGAFTARVNEWVAANPDSRLTSEYVKGFKEYQDLLARVQFEMAAFSAIARNEASGLQENGIQTGIAGAAELFNAVGGAVVSTAWNSPDPAALAALINYVDSAPFIERAGAFGENAANSLGDTILAFVAQGKNPRTIANVLSKWFLLPYAWAENTARTVQLWSYRQATHESYRANAAVLDGWVWVATLDARTCFPKGVGIHSQKGVVPIENVKIGDSVLTNSGRYQRVTETLKRSYEGEARTLSFGQKSITMTADHPVLVERLGKRYWLPAKECRIGDIVFIYSENSTDNQNHSGGNTFVKRRIAYPYNPVSVFHKAFNLASIGVRALMPIRTIDFNSKIKMGDKKVNGVTINSRLLAKVNAYLLKTKPEILFRLSFPIGLPVTRWAAILLMGLSRHNPKFFSASQTRIDYGRASARLRTIAAFIVSVVLVVFSRSKNLTTSLAAYVKGVFGFTLNTASRIPVSVRRGDAKILPAHSAFFGNTVSMNDFVARPTAIGSGFGVVTLEGYSTYSANNIYTPILSSGIASGGAVFTPSLSNPSVGDAEFFPTVVADSFSHHTIISNVASHIQCEVYNLEVENDHTYVADGLLVHNCLSCLSQHGQKFTLDQTLNDHHRGRCVAVPLVKGTSWHANMQTGADWFAGQPDGVQRELMGKGMYDLYTGGRFDWNKASVVYSDPVYGDMRRASTLGEMGG